MALSANKFNLTVQAMARGGASATGLLLNADLPKMALYAPGSPTPPVAADAVYATTLATSSAVEVATANGYTRPGAVVASSGVLATANSSGTETLKATQNWSSPTWTSSTGNVALRYFVLYDSTASSAVCNLLAWWDYGSTLTLAGANGDTLDISGSNINTTGWATLV